MPNGFTRSPKGEEAYKAVGKEYEDTMSDIDYQKFLKNNANSPHSARNKKTIQVFVRELADDGEQYLVYDLADRRYTPLGAESNIYVPNIGRYPIPIVQPKVILGDNMTVQEVQGGPIIRYDVGYEIPFTKENCDRLHDEMCNDKSQTARTQYIIKRYGGGKVSIPKYEDFRDGDFEDLEKNGKMTSASTSTLDDKRKKL